VDGKNVVGKVDPPTKGSQLCSMTEISSQQKW